MAKKPSAKVSMSSGQGVSRRSYQVARGLGQRGTGGADAPHPIPGIQSTPATGGGGRASGKRDYGKSESGGGSFNFGYSEREFANPDLKSLQLLGGGGKKPKAPKGFL
jgi:hypothetical protein